MPIDYASLFNTPSYTDAQQVPWQQRLGAAGKNFFGNRDLALALLANSGQSPVKRGFGEILGSSMLQADQAKQQRQDDEFKRQYMLAQMQAMGGTRKPIAVIGPDGKPVYVAESDAIGQAPYSAMNRAEAPASLQELDAENEARKQRGQPPLSISEWYKMKGQFQPLNPTVQLINGVPTLVQPTDRTGKVNVNPLSNPASERDAAAGMAGAKASGTGAAERQQAYINTGQDAADSLATVKRGLQLLDSIPTGGIDAAKLKATNLFGVTGADEAELSANLGKAVLSQLRATFGAQFTEKEGQRLAEIEAGFGKSTEGNKRLLQQAEKILDRAARRGIDAATQAGDTFSANEIKKAMEFTLDTNTNAPKVGTVEGGYRFKGGDPSKPQNWEKL